MSRPWLSFAVLGFIILLVNPVTLALGLQWSWLHANFAPGHYHGALLKALIWIIDIWALGTMVWMWFSGKSILSLWREAGVYLLCSWIAGLLAMLTLNPIYAGKLQYLRLIFLILLFLIWIRSFYLLVVRNPESMFRGVTTSLFSLGVLFHLLEGTFMFIARSHGNNTTLASRVWFERHWQVNEMGFRDADWDFKNAQGKKSLLLLGDSFVAGHGIKDTQNRFGEIIQGSLGQDWRVRNLGLNGADTQVEDSVLRLIPAANSRLTLICWYVNDIQDRALDAGMNAGFSGAYVPPVSFTHGSYLINYFTSLFPNADSGSQYLDFLHKAFNQEEVLKRHLDDLGQMCAHAKANSAAVAVVLFPMLHDIKGSEFALTPVRQQLLSLQVPFLDLSEAFSEYEPMELIVNLNDSHPNERGHRIAADAILLFIEKESLIPE